MEDEDITDDVIESRDVEETADDMLKELGFKEKVIDKHSITYKKVLSTNEVIFLDFSLLDKKVYVYYKNGLTYLTEGINHKLLIAIYKKMEELGWI